MENPNFLTRLVPTPVKRLVQQTEAYHSTVAFLAGFGYDSATLRRIDQLFDNFLLLFYLSALGLLLVWERRLAQGRATWGFSRRHRHLLHLGTQFLFGGLFSAYVIFYFKSASLGKSLFFVLLLGGLLLMNEYLGRRLRYERLQSALYFFCVFSFLLYFIPVLTGWMSSVVFLLAGTLAMGALAAVTWLVYRGASAGAPDEGEAPPTPERAFRSNASIGGAVFVFLFGLYWANVIPPVPLSLVHGGIYQGVVRKGDDYWLTYEKPSWWKFWRNDEREFRLRPSSTVHAFTAIFAPKGMEVAVWHRWEQRNARTGKWVQTDRIPFRVEGGRGAGYRGYTRKRHVESGKWRVVAETDEGREIGRINFEIVAGEFPEPQWETLVY